MSETQKADEPAGTCVESDGLDHAIDAADLDAILRPAGAGEKFDIYDPTTHACLDDAQRGPKRDDAAEFPLAQRLVLRPLVLPVLAVVAVPAISTIVVMTVIATMAAIVSAPAVIAPATVAIAPAIFRPGRA